MSQRDGFSSGFLLGTIVGGIVGGVVGALLTAKQFDGENSEEAGLNATTLEAKANKRKRVLKASGRSDMETARRSLEDKIAQLNDAIDDVRQQLGNVNGTTMGEPAEQSILKDPHGQG